MNSIWEMLILLEQQGIHKDEIFFKQAKEYSPYYEQAFSSLNEESLESRELEINSLYRFGSIFNCLFHPNLKNDEEFKIYLFDILVHTLAETDLKRGLCKRDYFIAKIQQDILMEYYGKIVKETFLLLNHREKYFISSFLLTQFQTGSSICLFTSVMKKIFPDGMIYRDNRNRKQLLIYVGKDKIVELDKQINLFIHLFLTIDYTVRIFYKHHFGVLDVEETLVLGDIEIL